MAELNRRRGEDFHGDIVCNDVIPRVHKIAKKRICLSGCSCRGLAKDERFETSRFSADSARCAFGYSLLSDSYSALPSNDSEDFSCGVAAFALIRKCSGQVHHDACFVPRKSTIIK